MTLEDNETFEFITNPYVTLYSPEQAWVALNAGTFAKAHNELVHVNDERTYIDFTVDKKSRLYRVVATVGKQDHPFDYWERSLWTRAVRVSGANDAISLVPLGYILEDIVKSQFPKSYAFFEKVRLKE